MITGSYVIRSNGSVVAEGSNIVTTTGLNMIKQFNTGTAPSYAQFIAYGTGDSAVSASDTKLHFEAGRVPVNLGAVMNGKMVWKASMPQEEAGSFTELGLFALSESLGSRIISSFESGIDSISGGTEDLSNSRLGLRSYNLIGPATAIVSDVATDLSDLGGTDEITLAYFQNSGTTSGITLRLMTDALNYYSLAFTPATGTGYKIVKALRSAMTTTGSPIISSITRIELEIAGTTNVSIDGMRAEKSPTSDIYKAVTHAVLTGPVVKVPGQQMDIEYTLEVNIA